MARRRDMNSAMFDREVLIFSQTYGTVPLGMVGTPTPITMINRLQISWKPEMIRELDPAPVIRHDPVRLRLPGPWSVSRAVDLLQGSIRELPIRAV